MTGEMTGLLVGMSGLVVGMSGLIVGMSGLVVPPPRSLPLLNRPLPFVPTLTGEPLSLVIPPSLGEATESTGELLSMMTTEVDGSPGIERGATIKSG